MLTITSKNERIIHKFIDILSPPVFTSDWSNKHDISHTIRCWEFLINKTNHIINCSKFYLVSDTGQPFKSYKLLYYFSRMKSDYGIECELHFFAPRHGYSLCDGHGGCMKRLLLRAQFQLGNPIISSKDLVSCLKNLKINPNSTFPYVLEHGLCSYNFSDFQNTPWISSTFEYSMTQCCHFVFYVIDETGTKNFIPGVVRGRTISCRNFNKNTVVQYGPEDNLIHTNDEKYDVYLDMRKNNTKYCHICSAKKMYPVLYSKHDCKQNKKRKDYVERGSHTVQLFNEEINIYHEEMKKKKINTRLLSSPRPFTSDDLQRLKKMEFVCILQTDKKFENNPLIIGLVINKTFENFTIHQYGNSENNQHDIIKPWKKLTGNSNQKTFNIGSCTLIGTFASLITNNRLPSEVQYWWHKIITEWHDKQVVFD